MKEIDYSLYDKESGLVIESLDNDNLRSLAATLNKSISETFHECQKGLKTTKLEYFVDRNNSIKVLMEGMLVKTPGTYFETYEEAKKYIKKQNKQSK